MIKTKTYQVTHSTLTLEDGRELELPIAGEVLEHAVTEREDGSIRVSYMLQDDDAQGLNPFTSCDPWMSAGDDLWQFFDSGRERDEWIERNISGCSECDNRAEDHPVKFFDWRGAEMDPCATFVHPNPTIKAAMDAGRFFWVERYEHGLVNYAPIGESSQVDRQWDVASGVGYIIIDDDWTLEPIEVARDMLQEYTDWCNGSVYGIVHAEFRPAVVQRTVDHRGMATTACEACGNIVMLFDEDTDDGCVVSTEESCWGFIGYEYAERTMREEHGE
jgi:hypothetical protein